VTTELRRLAAIVSADVAGYSRLMGRDESGTLAALKAIRREVVDPAIATHGGRIVKTTGDGLLLEFPSVVDAVRCAIKVQTEMAGRAAQVPDDKRIVLRVGVNLGDIIIDGEDIFGDGVNIAARLQEIAPPGGLCIASRVHDDVRDRFGTAFEPMGAQTLKNIARPLEAWRWSPAAGTISKAEPGSGAVTAPGADPAKPSIIVLPFLCPGGTPEQEAFADGLTESLITDLSRHPGHAVVARTTSLTFKGKATDVRELARSLGVRYMLEGSVQQGASRLRVNVQLISAGDGIHVWADRFDRERGDLLDLQDEIAERISRSVVVQLREAEINRAAESVRVSRDPATLLLLARRTFMQGASRANAVQADALYSEAVGIDDRNPLAHASLSIVKTILYCYRWSDTPEAELERAILHRDRARALDPNQPFTQVASAWILWAERKYAAALAAFERIARAAPIAGGNAFANLALAKNYTGRSAEAEAELLRVIRVTPEDPQMDVWHYYLGVTYVYLNRYEEAVAALCHCLSLNAEWDSPCIMLGAVGIQLGRMDDARSAVERALALGSRWTVTTLKAAPGSGIGVGIDDARMTALWDGLRQAGFPE
jgi:TolB-like protein/class 3 adenylate cyclase